MVPSVVLLLACSGGMTSEAELTADGPAGEDSDLPASAGPGPAELSFLDPGAGAFLRMGPAEVHGIARHMTTATLNGAPATLRDGIFTADLDLAYGLNTLEAGSTGEDGVAHEAMIGVLAGEFAAPEGVVRDAVQLHLSAEALAGVGPLAGGLLDPAALAATVSGLNPVMDTSEAEVNLGTLSFGTPELSLVPQQGYLDLVVRLPDFELPIDATIRDALPFGIDLDLGVAIECDEVLLRTRVDLGTDGNGHLTVDVGQLDAQLSEFDLDTGILELVDWLFLDDDDLAAFIEDALTNLGPQLDAMVSDLVGGLDLALETELLGQQLRVGPTFDRVVVTPDGLGVSVGVGLDVVGAERDVPGHLHLAPPPPTAGGEVHVQLADDFLNRALFELWAGGALDLELPLGPEDAAILVLFGGSGSGTLSLSAGLPPVWVERGGEGRLQMGELGLTVATPGGTYGEQVELVLSLDAKADLSVTPEAAGVVLSDGEVAMRLAGGSVGNTALAEKLPGLEAAFGIGIGMINEQLSFPLDGLVPAGTPLPPISLARDPSRRGSVVELTVADLAGLVPLLTGQPLPPPPPPNQVPVPATAAVLDDDESRSADAEEAWVCEDREIETSGDAGTWYLMDGAELVVTGTGHVIWATDGAYVRLEAPGNTVFADPGADVDDDDGTNVVTEVDPLTLDLAGAPSPGCN